MLINTQTVRLAATPWAKAAVIAFFMYVAWSNYRVQENIFQLTLSFDKWQASQASEQSSVEAPKHYHTAP